MGAARLDTFLRRLSGAHRVLLLGGLGVIAHGLPRTTKDADVWLEPMDSPEEWAGKLARVCADFSEIRLARLPHWMPVANEAELAAAVRETGIVRVLGFECPLDIFRQPNEFDAAAFDDVWSRATLKDDGVFLPAPLDLLQTKMDTGRESDRGDIAFLEGKVRTEFGARAAVATPEEARALFERYADHAVCARALENPHPEVRALARELLGELAAQGDWFSRDILARIEERG